MQWLSLSDDIRCDFYLIFLNFSVYNKHILLLNLKKKKRYVTKSLLRLELDGDQACDPALQPAGCVLMFQRLYMVHVIYVKVLFYKMLSIKLMYEMIAVVLTTVVAK